MLDPARTLFTFPDGVFSYDCRGCGACCKGLGIGLDSVAGEVAHLASAYPQIIPFLRRRGDATTAFNPRDRCWFLDDGGLCRIETEHGRARKPASCRLFPFNRVFRIGSWTVVDFNSVICPLQVGGERATTHAEIADEIGAVADPAVVGTQLPAADPMREGRELVERERAIAAACFTAAPTGDLDAAWAAQSDAPRADLPDLNDAFALLTGAPWRAPEGPTLAAALWLTPSLRFNELYGPRQYADRDAIVRALPRMWLAWLGFAAGGAALAGRALGLQELTTIWSEQAPLAYAIARWLDPPRLEPGPIELPPGDAARAVRRIAQACIDNKRAGKPLGVVLAPVLESLSPIDRITSLKAAEPVLRAIFRAGSKRAS